MYYYIYRKWFIIVKMLIYYIENVLLNSVEIFFYLSFCKWYKIFFLKSKIKMDNFNVDNYLNILGFVNLKFVFIDIL